MVTEYVIGRPIPLPLDLSLLSERVLNSLSRVERLTNADRIVLNKAAEFLEEVHRGSKAVRSLELCATTGRDIESFGLAMNAYKILGKKRNARTKAMRIEKIAGLLDIANQLAQAQQISLRLADIQDLREFFESVKEVTSRYTAGEIDRVHLG